MHHNILSNPALQDRKSIEQNEEWNNFMHKVGHVSSLVKDLASGDKNKAEAAKKIADEFLNEKVILDEDVEMKVKHNRTVINQKAFKAMNDNKDKGEMDKETWMAEMSKDAEMRFQDRKIRREKADTLNTMAIKAFRRGEYDKALSCYNRAIEHVKDNPMLYCDRALTYIKLGKYDNVPKDCDSALRLNENSYKAHLYLAKAYKELEDAKYKESRKDLETKFSQHEELTKYFLKKREDDYGESEEEEEEEELEEEEEK